MKRHSQKPLPRVVAVLLALTGLLIYLAGLPLPAGAQDDRVLQVWPDRSVGVASGLPEGSAGYAFTEVLPLGVALTSTGDIVQGRTYLHFPLDVFPPGTEIVQATLHLYVDGASREGEATVGAYRVLDPWGEEGWESDPRAWPALFASPAATALARFDVVTVTMPAFIPAPIATPPPSSAPTSTPVPASAPTATPTPTSPTSPLATPPDSPISTPTVAVEPTAGPTPTPPPSLPPSLPVVTLGQVAGTWLAWDVTALMQSYLAGGSPDYGLALAPAPDADPETAGDLLAARWFDTQDPETMPYLIVEIKVHPVTPTATPAPVLPSAGGAVGLRTGGLLLVGAALLALGLIARHR